MKKIVFLLILTFLLFACTHSNRAEDFPQKNILRRS